MYSRTEKKYQNKNKTNIYDLADKIQSEIDGKNEAALIMNAYRKVQQIRVDPNTSASIRKSSKQAPVRKSESTSTYANKVKQTLKQLNANKKKQMQALRQIPKPVIDEKGSKKGPAERHLFQTGLKKLFKLLDKKYQQYIKLGFQMVVKAGNSHQQSSAQAIRLWRLRRIFSGWQYESMLSKIEKEKLAKVQQEKEKKYTSLADDFHYFWTIKTVYKGWSTFVRRQLKKRELQLAENLRRQAELKALVEQNENPNEIQQQRKKQVATNIQLQNKLRGFLNGLKQDITAKERLITVKQKTEEEDPREQTNNCIEPSNNNESSSEITSQQQQEVPKNEGEEVIGNEGAGETAQENQRYWCLTNEELEKRRKQMEKKSKQRKQALDKLKKDRENKKKQQEEQRIALQKEIQEEQKKARQEQYRKFMKQRKEEEEWKLREKELQRQADEFNRLRITKFYGWVHWIKLKQVHQSRAQSISQLLQNIFMKRALEKLITGILQTGEAKLQLKYKQANEYHIRKLKKRCMKKLKQWRDMENQQKQEYEIRHSVYTLKIYFKEWQRCRNLIQLENYEWERPRMKRAECLYAMTLLNKSFESLKINRDQEKQQRTVEEQKAKIKEKLKKIVEEEPTINYDDFL